MKTNIIPEKTSINKAGKRQADLLNDVQKSNQVGSWEWEPGTDHYFWADSMFFLHGLCPASDNLISIEAAHQMIHPEDFDLVQNHWEELNKTGYADYYFRIITPDGKIRRLHARGRTVITDTGFYVLRGNYQDETAEVPHFLQDEIKKAEIRINILDKAEQIAQMGTWQINLTNFETDYSDNVYRLHGLAPQAVNPHPDTFVKYLHPEDREIVLDAFEKSYHEKIPLHLEYRIIRQDEEERYIKQVSSVIKNEKGEQLLTGTTHDITEKKWLEFSLHQSYDSLKLQHQLFQQAEQMGAIGTWQVNVQTREVYYSDNIYIIHGLKPQSVVGTLETFLAYIHPEDKSRMEETYAKILEGNTLPLLQYHIVGNDGKISTLRQITKQTSNIYGDKLIIGIIQDITEQHAFKMQLNEINQKLLIQNESFIQAEKIVAIGNWFWNLTTGQIHYSDNIYHIHGIKPGSQPNKIEGLSQFVHPEDRGLFNDIISRIKAEEPVIDSQYRILLTNGELRYLRNRNKLITSPEGQKIVIGTIQDITHEMALQQQLSERIDFAEMLSDTILDMIIVTDTANNIIGCNKNCEKTHQFKKEDVLKKNIFNVFPQLKNAEMIENFHKALMGKTIHIPAVRSLFGKGYHDLLMRPLKNKKDQIIGVLMLLHDVTEEYQLRQQLQMRLSFIEKLVESSIDRIMVLDNNLNYIIWNKNCENYYGVKKEEIIGRNVLELFPMFKTDPIYQDCKKALKGENIHIPVKKNNGQDYFESFLVPIKNEKEEVSSILWIIHDVTDIMQAREQLVISETHLKTAQEIAHLGSWEYDHNSGMLSWSDEVFRMYGYEPASFDPTIDFYISTSHPENRTDIQKILSIHGERYSFINRIYTLDARLRYIQTMGRPVSDGADKTIKVIGTMQDITEQKILQDQLHEKTKAIRSQYEIARQAEMVQNVCTWQWNLGTGTVFWSENVFRLLGYAPYAFEPTIEKFISFVHPDDKEMVLEIIENIKKMETKTLSLMKYRVIDRDGKTKYLHTQGRVAQNTTGKYVTGTIHEITDYVTLEQRLKRNDQLLQTIIDSSNEAISIYDNYLNCLVWNKHCEKIYGRRKDEAIGKYLFDLIPQLNDERSKAQVQQILEDESVMNMDSPRIEFENSTIELSSVAYGTIKDKGLLIISKVV